MKVVSKRDCLERGICQNPLLASSFVNTFAPDSCASVSSTLGRGWTSRRTLLFSGLRSTTFPDFFGTTTIPAHHWVGSSTLDITPIASILASSCATFGLSGRAMLCGVVNANGCTSGFSFISNSSPRYPRPLETPGNCCMMSALVCIVWRWERSCRAVIAGSPSRFVVSSFIACCELLPLWETFPSKDPSTSKGCVEGPNSFLSGVFSVGCPRCLYVS